MHCESGSQRVPGGERSPLTVFATPPTGEHPVAWHNFHATVLYLFGIDHEWFTFYHNGIGRRRTNVHGEVVKEILA